MNHSSDIYFNAFLKLKGFQRAAFQVIGRGKVRCDYNISNEKWNELKLEFDNSEFAQFKAYVEQVKDLAY